jgi:hypothetical protein
MLVVAAAAAPKRARHDVDDTDRRHVHDPGRIRTRTTTATSRSRRAATTATTRTTSSTPSATEHCDGVDEDCNDDIDENAIGRRPVLRRHDADGYGDRSSPR